MPVLVLILVSLGVGLLSAVASYAHYRRGAPAAPVAAARGVGEAVADHPGLRRALVAKVDPRTATGLALVLALLLIIGSGILLGVLAVIVRTDPTLARVDRSVANWGHRHATGWTDHVVNVVTYLGSTYVVVALGLAVAAIEYRRTRNRWVLPFLVVALAGNGLLTLAVKNLVRRVRPDLSPLATHLGPSFPSGHTSSAAVLYACIALLLGRGRGRTTRALLAGGAVALTVAVACSRVLLDVHWLTDVIAGAALGWAWFAVCVIAFGGRVLRFGATAETVATVAASTPPAARTDSSHSVRAAQR